MDVLKISSTSGYAHSTSKFFNFGRFSNKAGRFVLLEGGFEQNNQWEQFGLSEKALQQLLKKKIVRIELEEPNKFFIGDDSEKYDHYFYRIFTICPYTAGWYNKKNKNKRRFAVFYPFNEEDIPKKEKKKYDINYSGNIVSKTLLKDLEVMSKFNYRLISNSPHILVTDKKTGHGEKMKLIAQSKITLVHNLLYPNPYHMFNIMRFKGYKDNEAFKLVPRRYQLWKLINWRKIVTPQLKSRVFEAAFSHSLILCKYDEFNLIERFFKPDKEFIYYKEGELESKIRELLNNFTKYEKVVENAYKRAITNYTTKIFFEKYLKNLD